MKRTLIMFLFVFSSLLSYAPNIPVSFYIPMEKPIVRTEINYDPLIEAIFRWETRGLPDSLAYKAYNKKEQATGGLQVRPCRLEHFNQLTKKNYTLNDMYNFNIATEVFLYFTNHNSKGKKIPNKSYERAAKDWNGSGPKVNDYWDNVKIMV